MVFIYSVVVTFMEYIYLLLWRKADALLGQGSLLLLGSRNPYVRRLRLPAPSGQCVGFASLAQAALAYMSPKSVWAPLIYHRKGCVRMCWLFMGWPEVLMVLIILFVIWCCCWLFMIIFYCCWYFWCFYLFGCKHIYIWAYIRPVGLHIWLVKPIRSHLQKFKAGF